MHHHLKIIIPKHVFLSHSLCTIAWWGKKEINTVYLEEKTPQCTLKYFKENNLKHKLKVHKV